MTDARAVELLNCLLRTLCRSVAAYARDARPWARPDQQELVRAIDDLADDQQHYARRVTDAILELGGAPEPDTFPLDYSAINDIAIDYLLQAVIEGQDRDLAQLEQCAIALAELPPLGDLAREILGNARGHAEILAKLLAAAKG
jgi:bacterioferritin (cytochrome b1)